MPTTDSTILPATVASGQAIQLGSIEQVLAQGDLAKMTPDDRTRYLVRVCETLNLNVYTRPFQYIMLSGKLTLYATRDAADQLRKLHGVSIRIADRTRQDDIYIVTAEATDRTGRTDSSIGAVSVAGLKGEALANAFMKAETKAKRRVTLSVCGLGFLDETEVETVPNTTTVAQPALPAPTAAVQALPPELKTLGIGKAFAQWMARAQAHFPDPAEVSRIARDLAGVEPCDLVMADAASVLRAIENSWLRLDSDGRYVLDEPPAEADRRAEV